MEILYIHISQKKKVYLVIPVYLHLKHPDWSCIMKSSCYLFSWHKERKNLKLVKIRTIGKYWTFNLTKYVNVCFLVLLYFLLWNTENYKLPVQWSLTGNLYVAYPVGQGLWSIRALLHSVLNKTLTPYFGSNSTMNSLRISKLTWNLAGDIV